MGIDISAHWCCQSEAESDAQARAWLSVNAGGAGYLREAYHGEPYATMHLCAEAFPSGKARIPASLLRERLPRTLELAEERERTVYRGTDSDVAAVQDSYRAFVELCEAKERQCGEPVLIEAWY